jgi:hypothetical protein
MGPGGTNGFPTQEVRVAESQYDVRTELLKTLLSKVEQDPYPSSTTMNLIEELLTPDEVPSYARILLGKVADEQFPSVSMLGRIRDLAV